MHVLLFLGFMALLFAVAFVLIGTLIYSLSPEPSRYYRAKDARAYGFVLAAVFAPSAMLVISGMNLLGGYHYTYTSDTLRADQITISELRSVKGEASVKVVRHDAGLVYSIDPKMIVENAPENKIVYFTGCKYNSAFKERVLGCSDLANTEPENVRIDHIEITGTIPK
ncbi:hypothetical protein SEA_NICEHOUSE_165 [Rhodococcus phage NiceHouse]|nr:hypothetical protein SEA_NICEHOUSE_165 [Rhodococcus phage NiceHouse]